MLKSFLKRISQFLYIKHLLKETSLSANFNIGKISNLFEIRQVEKGKNEVK
jgi:hypothetical protein